MSPNQFWENELIGGCVSIAGTCPGPGDRQHPGRDAERHGRHPGLADARQHDARGRALPGLLVDLDDPAVVATPTADGSGTVTLNPSIGDAFCDHYVQIVDASECAVSNLIAIP